MHTPAPFIRSALDRVLTAMGGSFGHEALFSRRDEDVLPGGAPFRPATSSRNFCT